MNTPTARSSLRASQILDLEVPAGWDDKTVTTFVGSAAVGEIAPNVPFYPTITIAPIQTAESSVHAVATQLFGLTSRSATVVDGPTETHVEGTPAIVRVISISGASPIHILQHQCVCGIGSAFFLVSLTTTNSEQASSARLFRELLVKLRFRNQLHSVREAK